MEIPQLQNADYARIRDLAMRKAGISLGPSKQAMVVSRWGKRLACLGITNFGDYLDLLASPAKRDELQTALDLLTTNETYFFREPKHFKFLSDHLPRAIDPGAAFRVWSAACSSGEEPYSIAMLLASRLNRASWEILATDISTRVLATAREGLYEMDRLERIPPEYVRAYCRKGTGTYAGRFLIDRDLRERVRFEQVNLNETLPRIGSFDVIFLRNVMIYFDADTKSKIVSHIFEKLSPGGHFIIGHCDSLAATPPGLQQVQPSIFRRVRP